MRASRCGTKSLRRESYGSTSFGLNNNGGSMISRIAPLALAAALLPSLAAPLSAHAQAYPTKPVRIIVPYAPGGNTDFTARAVADKLSDAFKRQFIVDNRPGAATNIG